MKKEKILWGVKKGDPDWKEEILSTRPENFDRVKQLAKRDGWERFRVSTTSLDTPPDFTKTVNPHTETEK